MKSFLKKFKKSEVAIYTIAIMLVAAGYLNYTTMDKPIIETSSKTESEENKSIGDAQLVNSDEIVKKNNTNKAENKTKDNSEIKEENKKENVINDNITNQESVETSSNENDYFVSSKLDRDTNYASMISNYTAILEKDNISEPEKKTAMKEIDNINNEKKAIMICENLLSTKDFKNNVVFINDKSVNVVVKTEGGLNKEKVAQIQNIISRELKTDINNIHITEK